MSARYTPGPWKAWNSGWANAPTIIYMGENAPSLGRNNKLKMNGSALIAEVSTQNMHLTGAEDVVRHLNDRLIAAAPDLLKLIREVLEWNEDDADLATNDTAFRLKNFADTVANRSAALRAALDRVGVS